MQSTALPRQVGFTVHCCTADPYTCLGGAQRFWVDGSQTKDALQWFCSLLKERNPRQVYMERKKKEETTYENPKSQMPPRKCFQVGK